ncbi:MAG: SIR2 family protein [Acidobacteriota bacterium]
MSINPPSREALLGNLADAALFGSFGLFVGTGLSRALTKGTALSFKDLLVSVSRQLGVDLDFEDVDIVCGKSYPQLAEEIAQLLSQSKNCSYSEATLGLKRAICRACDLQADASLTTRYREAMELIRVQWVITTNYDFILEDLIPNSVSLLPNELLIPRVDFVPIYHFHGHVRSAASIVVTDSDYIRLLAPTEYRQLKLNLLMAESSTLMLGYSLGDINVKTALEWSRAFGAEWGLRAEAHQSLVVQALYKPGATRETEPYFGLNGEVIIEVGDLSVILGEVSKAIETRRLEYTDQKGMLADWINVIPAGNLADDDDLRIAFLDLLSRLPRLYDLPAVIRYLGAVLDPIWERARADCGWSHYDRFLCVLLDVFRTLPTRQIHPSLLSYLGDQLDYLSWYIDSEGRTTLGTSFAASRTWLGRKEEIPKETWKALVDFATYRSRYRLLNLLSDPRES